MAKSSERSNSKKRANYRYIIVFIYIAFALCAGSGHPYPTACIIALLYLGAAIWYFIHFRKEEQTEPTGPGSPPTDGADGPGDAAESPVADGPDPRASEDVVGSGHPGPGGGSTRGEAVMR